jgi:NAD(P)-dependent dehydrogenase (short-subunit alcohol dehydrogenase family)
VLITGSSTGIGNHAAIQLAKAGYLVFAGVRKQADGEALVAAATAEGAGANIVPVLIDVSVSESIASAARNVSELLSGTYKDRKLAAIVNNAGIGYLAAVETIPMHAVSAVFACFNEIYHFVDMVCTLSPLTQVKSLFEVNVFGLVETTQVFLPMLHAHGPGARIVNIGSISGIYSPPSHAIYAATSAIAILFQVVLWSQSCGLLRFCTLVPRRVRCRSNF